MSVRAYHFVGDRLRDGRPVPADGEWLEHDGPIAICKSGLHASRRPWYALAYAPGPVLCLVEVEGIVAEQRDKLVARRRRIVRRVDLTDDLRAFARQCALDVIHIWEVPDVVRRYLDTGDESLRTDAWNAAWNAAKDAARDDATWEAAWAAAWAADARDAAMAAARAAAWAAARDAAAAAQGERFDALCAARLGLDISGIC